MAKTTSSPATTSAWVRNWRHDSQIIPSSLHRVVAGVRMLPTSHVGQDHVFEADRLDGPCLLQHRAMAPHDETGLSVRVAGVDHLLIGGVAGGITAGGEGEGV